ncbi:DUF3618 domain-containing protein [Kineosporia rhizophila]|uniref:DUF3618 domain-containing protein n=1 Tax=Kineosporia TaxID=49184 RepID=UPI001E4EEB19|nr:MULTISPECIES: DUF3618 domain-containing protein [Kineosporia]MCE0539130.1 DUF3618 domain-containing protein [Kineosporia rhizophila]GLY18108.1 hypothetical protein Kisp01_51220 [Kineosporia sp. NBRC 101677]
MSQPTYGSETPRNETPEEIRARIENTRQELSTDVNTLAETVRPSNVAKRQADKARDAVGSVRDRVMGTAGTAKEKVMGSASSAGNSASSTLGDARSAVGSAASSSQEAVASAAATSQEAIAAAPGAVKARTEGNPLAAGLIAFGAGMLLGSLLPATRKEEEAVAALKENASTLTGPASEVAQEVGQHLRESAQEAAESVRSTAGEAAQTVKDEAASAGQDVKDQGVQAKERVQETRS